MLPAGLGAVPGAVVAVGALVDPVQVAGRLGFLRRMHPLHSALAAAVMHPLGSALLAVLGPPFAGVFTLLRG